MEGVIDSEGTCMVEQRGVLALGKDGMAN